MAIKIYNSLTRKKEEFVPIKKSKVGIYGCGPTVYDEPHIGHARSAYTFDVIKNYLEYRGYKVRFVRNITDIDDKIIDKARGELKKSLDAKVDLKSAVKEIAMKYLNRYYEDMDTLGIKRADFEPKATEYIGKMIKVIKRLIEKGSAYAQGGDVYFAINKFSSYGSLSGQSLDKMQLGARVHPGENKRDPLDFALWKSAKPEEPAWKSPWGMGRPGWHIECSTMSMDILGENFDIHGGGLDLIFPHHENEIAQSESYSGKRFANYWIHNGLLTIKSEKMAKSLGNFISIKDILDKHHPEVLKFFLLSGHYHSPIDFTYAKMDEAKAARERFYILFDKIERVESLKALDGARGEEGLRKIDDLKAKFEEAMDDDFNTSLALGYLYEIVSLAN
ncbi:MAG: cysteine--tRNA ligase, partial [Candidatus Omnitrophota bacterium]